MRNNQKVYHSPQLFSKHTHKHRRHTQHEPYSQFGSPSFHKPQSTGLARFRPSETGSACIFTAHEAESATVVVEEAVKANASAFAPFAVIDFHPISPQVPDFHASRLPHGFSSVRPPNQWILITRSVRETRRMGFLGSIHGRHVPHIGPTGVQRRAFTVKRSAKRSCRFRGVPKPGWGADGGAPEKERSMNLLDVDVFLKHKITSNIKEYASMYAKLLSCGSFS